MGLLVSLFVSLFFESKEEVKERERVREAKIKETAEENQQLREQVAQLKASSETLSQSLCREEDAKDKALAQNQRLSADVDAARRQLETRDIELKDLRGELHNAQTKRDELTTLLDARTCELKGARVFLTKADTLSGAEIIALIEALNVEIFQTSACISVFFDFARRPKHVDKVKEASARISELMGPTLAHLLDTVTHSEGPLLVQIALQGATVEFARWLIMTWDFDRLQAKQLLAKIYNDIRESELQAVSGRWRALTRAHAQKVALQEADLHATMVAHISDTLVTILVAAGITNSHEEAYRTFTQKFGERISNIVRMASRLNKAMGEEVTSADLWPTSATSDEKFDGAIMDDFEAPGESSDGQTVLCTTALGLHRSERVVQGDAVEFKMVALLKPKVALETVAAELQRDDA